MSLLARIAVVVSFCSAPLLAFAIDDMPAAAADSRAEARAYPAPPMRGETSAAAVVATLAQLPDDDLAALRRWNDGGNVPARIGVIRELPAARVRISPPVAASAAVSPTTLHWRGAVTVAGSQRVRLKLTDVDLPPGTILWVYGTAGAAIGFDPSLIVDGVLWTPSVDGPTITLEVASPAAGAAFTIAAAADIRRPAEVIAQGTECMVDATCQPAITDVASSVAHLQYVTGGAVGMCSGALIVDGARTFPPHLLTANHCISTAAQAASLEAFWDFRPPFCGGPPPALSTLPRTRGASVLVTSADTDVTLLRLSSVPGRRWYLGWSAGAVPAGTALYRISHPYGWSQGYSVSVVEGVAPACAGWPRPQRIYSSRWLGGVAGGSSGSPVFTGDGRIVGQLTGGCGPLLTDPCNSLNRQVDGAMALSYSLLKPYIDAPVNPCAACTPNANTACMLDNRFKVTLTWKDHSANLSGNGSVLTFADNRPETNPTYGAMSQTTFFSMYPNAPNSIEVLVRMLRGVNINNKFWVFLTGFSPNEYTLTVTDTKNCATWSRTNASGNFAAVADYNAFPF